MEIYVVRTERVNEVPCMIVPLPTAGAGLQDGRSVDIVYQSDARYDEQTTNNDAETSLRSAVAHLLPSFTTLPTVPVSALPVSELIALSVRLSHLW